MPVETISAFHLSVPNAIRHIDLLLCTHTSNLSLNFTKRTLPTPHSICVWFFIPLCLSQLSSLVPIKEPAIKRLQSFINNNYQSLSGSHKPKPEGHEYSALITQNHAIIITRVQFEQTRPCLKWRSYLSNHGWIKVAWPTSRLNRLVIMFWISRIRTRPETRKSNNDNWTVEYLDITKWIALLMREKTS